VDFGLASRFTTSSEYKRDPKKAHNGTIEYTSRDAHMGGNTSFLACYPTKGALVNLTLFYLQYQPEEEI